MNDMLIFVSHISNSNATNRIYGEENIDSKIYMTNCVRPFFHYQLGRLYSIFISTRAMINFI